LRLSLAQFSDYIFGGQLAVLDLSTTVQASFAKISSEGNRLPSSMSERKGGEMSIWSANLRKDKPALLRNFRIRWPKEISIIC
jgi:hypothetical protein